MRNALLILMDQQTNYMMLPQEIRDLLPGYNAFRKIGIEFTNIKTNRMDCSQSRAVSHTSVMDTGIQELTNQQLQIDTIPYLDENLDTPGKVFKRNDYKTCFYGKNHFDGRLTFNIYKTPSYTTSTKGCAKVYGYDSFNTWGEASFSTRGMFNDCMYLEHFQPPNSSEYDYQDKITGDKFEGVLPYLRARAEDNKKFFLEFDLTNPHDIENAAINLTELYGGQLIYNISQFYFPFMEEQAKELGTPNPYVYNKDYTDAYIKNPNLTTNYLDKTFEEYKTNLSNLPFLQSFLDNNGVNPKYNRITPFLAGFQEFYNYFNTIGTNDTKNVMVWKNLVNTYYGLMIEVDSYLFKIYKEMEKLDLLKNTVVIITADHGEHLGSHGLRSKGAPWDTANSIPFIVCSPDLTVKGVTNDYLGSTLDMIPTMIDLCNLKFGNYEQYCGESLFYRDCKCKLSPKSNQFSTKTIPYLWNTSTALNSYFTYLAWYENSTPEIKAKVYRNPNNYYEYQFNYMMCYHYVNGKLYKFGRYYSLLDLLIQNATQLIIPKSYFVDALTTLVEKEPVFIDIRNQLLSVLQDKVNVLVVLELLFTIFGNGNNPVLLTYITLVYKYLAPNQILKGFLPGIFSDFDTILSNGKLTMFCYNLTDDPNEIIDLVDPNNYLPSNHSLFIELNSKLNQSFINSKMAPCINLIPWLEILKVIQGIIQNVGKIIRKDFIREVILITGYQLQEDGYLMINRKFF